VTVLKPFYLIKLTAFSYWNVFILSQPQYIIHVSFTLFPTAEVFLTFSFKAVFRRLQKWNGIGASNFVTGKLKNKNTFVPNLQAIIIKWLCQTAAYYNMYSGLVLYIEFPFLFSHIRDIKKKKNVFLIRHANVYIVY